MAGLTKLDRSMVPIYARRVLRGDISVEDVPARIRELVRERVEGRGGALRGPFPLERGRGPWTP